MNFINCLLDVSDGDSDKDLDQGFPVAVKDRARQMAGIAPDELSSSDSD